MTDQQEVLPAEKHLCICVGRATVVIRMKGEEGVDEVGEVRAAGIAFGGRPPELGMAKLLRLEPHSIA